MLMELIAAILIIAIYVPLARRLAKGDAPKGAWWNVWEGLLTFVRDFVARPSLKAAESHEHGHDEHGHDDHGHHGHHRRGLAIYPRDPDKEVDLYVPYLWTLFLFLLFCNLLGMIPFMGSPTASPVVTGVLATFSFILFHGAATAKMGFLDYMKSLWPKMDMPIALAVWVKPMIFGIELMGVLIKSFVLAVRLFANMFAGHLVLSVILFFIVLATPMGVIGWSGVTIASVLGVVALSLLELFVAFLQAFIFTFLTALFLGMSINPQH
jgi:F-type H+-transporting ATPase subunit a